MSITVYSDQIWERGEECGILGIISKTGKDVAPLVYKGLIALQHRGQDAAGMAISDGRKINAVRGLGLVSDVFKEKDLRIRGHIGIGHTRYPTIGGCERSDVQPTVLGDAAVAHNGHIANYEQLRTELEEDGCSFKSTVDSEPMAYLINKSGIEEGVRAIINRFEGSFSDVAICEGRLAVFRDRFGLRPLVWAENEDFICFASESVAFDINGIPYKGELEGGCLALLDHKKMERKRILDERTRHCMFEYVYFSRPDSIINGKSVFALREALGTRLAWEHPVDADIVVPVPDTARTAAGAYARELGIANTEGLIKNRYIGRTFIMPTDEKRIEAVRMKLNPVKGILEGKRVVLVDDSIVRGTTLKSIVKLVRGVGAEEVHLRITCPPIKSPCFYGVDMSTYNELIANNKNIEEIKEFLDANSLGYLSIEGLKDAVGSDICTGCLDEAYLTEFVMELAKERKGDS